MKFGEFKQFRDILSKNVDDVLSYLSVDLTKTLRELAIGLTRLTLEDNFECFVKEVTIVTMTELAIRNELRGGRVPLYRLILRGGDGSQDVVDGDQTWSQDFVYLKNTGASDVTLTVAFFR